MTKATHPIICLAVISNYYIKIVTATNACNLFFDIHLTHTVIVGCIIYLN